MSPVGSGTAAAPRSSLAQAAVVALTVAAGLAAFVTAPAAALVSRMCWRPSLVTVPYGLLLSVAASAAVVLLSRQVSRVASFVAVVGWLVGLGFVVNGTSGGSFLIAGDGLGWGFLILGTVATIWPALWGSARR